MMSLYMPLVLIALFPESARTSPATTLILGSGTWFDACEDSYIYGSDQEGGRPFTRTSTDNIACFRGSWAKDDAHHFGMKIATIYDTAQVTISAKVWFLCTPDIGGHDAIDVRINEVQMDYLQRTEWHSCSGWNEAPYDADSWMSQECLGYWVGEGQPQHALACYTTVSYTSTVAYDDELNLSFEGDLDQEWTDEAWGVSDITITVEDVMCPDQCSTISFDGCNKCRCRKDANAVCQDNDCAPSMDRYCMYTDIVRDPCPENCARYDIGGGRECLCKQQAGYMVCEPEKEGVLSVDLRAHCTATIDEVEDAQFQFNANGSINIHLIPFMSQHWLLSSVLLFALVTAVLVFVYRAKVCAKKGEYQPLL